ncbi:MAG TPA: response regulator [Gemmatimonadaceae bacterium]|jgi:DNA-binding response OmpR family regulator|nr:response regulator [Gemmatimonadaceae bacterium]
MASAQTVARASDALRTLRERFRETSAGTITMLEDLARQLGTEPTSPDAIAALRRELHRVHGTAGSYGFAEASRLAAKLEQRVGDWENDPTLERTQRATIIGHFVSALRLAMSAEAAIGHVSPSRRRMLLVDVAPNYARALRSDAALRGYQLTSGRAGDLTAAALREVAPHVVVVSVEQIAELRELSAGANVPLIALAQGATLDDAAAAAAAGVATVDVSDELGTLFDIADRLSLGSSTAGATILVLDDDPSILTIVQFLLESEGIRIMTCEHPRALHEQLAATAPSLLVMDVRMGEVSGIDLARELRTLPAYRDLPIVLISADTEERTKEQARRAGVDDFLAKPIAAPELRACIARHLERQRVVRLSEGRHPGTGLPLPPRTASDVTRFTAAAAEARRSVAMVIVRPDVDDLVGDAATGWLRETQRIANAVASSASVVGYHDGVSLMAVLEGDAELAESLFEALVFGRSEGAPAWRCGVVDSADVGADPSALRRGADEAIEMSRQDRASLVRRWRRDEAGLAPDIILIEDDPALSDMVQYVLRAAGLSFRAFNNGVAALEALLGFRADGRRPLVLLDVDLPGLDGHAVHERLRAERPDVYAVVFITGNGTEGDQIRALRAGALDYVSKPVSFRTLSGKIPLWRERAAAR